MICRGDREKAGTFTVKPGTYEPIMGIYDPINGCGGTAGIELDTDFDIDPRDIKYTMMEPRGGKWESDRIDLYTPQDCFGFSEPFAGRIEYSEKKPKIAVDGEARSRRPRTPRRVSRPAATVRRPCRAAAGSGSRGDAMADRDAKRKRPITCLETGVTFESAYRAAKELGFADSRNIFRSIQRGTCTQGLHFYYADAPKPSPEFFLPPNRPPRPVVCLDTGETFESAFQAGRAFGIAARRPCAHRPARASNATGSTSITATSRNPGPEFFRERHSKTRPIVCLETGETFDGQPGRRAPPARIAGRHQPGRSLRNARRRAPFLPWRRAETGSGVLQAGEGERRQEPRGRWRPRQGPPLGIALRVPIPRARWPAAPTRGIIDAVGKAPSVSEGAFLRLLGTVSVFMRRARRFPAGPAFPWVSLMAEGFLVPGKKTLKGVIG